MKVSCIARSSNGQPGTITAIPYCSCVPGISKMPSGCNYNVFVVLLLCLHVSGFGIIASTSASDFSAAARGAQQASICILIDAKTDTCIQVWKSNAQHLTSSYPEGLESLTIGSAHSLPSRIIKTAAAMLSTRSYIAGMRQQRNSRPTKPLVR